MSPVRVRLAELRTARGLTQQELSEQSGVRQAAISEIESGKKRRIDLDMLERLATALGVEPGDLFVRVAAPKGKRPTA